MTKRCSYEGLNVVLLNDSISVKACSITYLYRWMIDFSSSVLNSDLISVLFYYGKTAKILRLYLIFENNVQGRTLTG